MFPDEEVTDGARDDSMIDPITIHIPEGVPLTTVMDLLHIVDGDSHFVGGGSIGHPVEFYISRRSKK